MIVKAARYFIISDKSTLHFALYYVTRNNEGPIHTKILKKYSIMIWSIKRLNRQLLKNTAIQVGQQNGRHQGIDMDTLLPS